MGLGVKAVEHGFSAQCEEASLFFWFVTYRYGRGSILITTNTSVRDWTELLAGDDALAAVILDRTLHKAHVLNIKGGSYRLGDLETTLGTQRPRSHPPQPGCAKVYHKANAQPCTV